MQTRHGPSSCPQSGLCGATHGYCLGAEGAPEGDPDGCSLCWAPPPGPGTALLLWNGHSRRHLLHHGGRGCRARRGPAAEAIPGPTNGHQGPCAQHRLWLRSQAVWGLVTIVVVGTWRRLRVLGPPLPAMVLFPARTFTRLSPPRSHVRRPGAPSAFPHSPQEV